MADVNEFLNTPAYEDGPTIRAIFEGLDRNFFRHIRDAVRLELEDYDRQKAEALREGTTVTPDVRITGDVGAYVEGVDRAQRRGNQS